VLTLILWGVAIWSATKLDGIAQTIIVIALVVVSLYPLVKAIYRLLRWNFEEYVVTDHRIIQVEGILNRKTFDSALEKVNDVQMTQSIFGRVFNFGNIDIITGSELGVNHLTGIADPFAFKHALLESKTAMSRPPASRRVESDENEDGLEAARLLAALTDLRDSGVITADEYESRRRQMLNS
jgi:uncharacterized membrane protein YdbT with pleckstrin-like domain